MAGLVLTSVIKGTFALNGQIFDRWCDVNSFRRDFEDICGILQYRSGLQIVLDVGKLDIVHERFQSVERAWLELLLPEGTTRLSHLKMCAILLETLSELAPIEVHEAAGEIPSDLEHSYQDGGPGHYERVNQMDERDIKKILDGGSQYIGWLVAYHICCHFEAERTDRIDPFEERVTEEFEIDLVSGLFSGMLKAQAIHLVLKALFLRD